MPSPSFGVTTYVILGMGERRELIEEGCRRAIEMGVYPFVVPIRPVPGTLLEHTPTPDPDYVAAAMVGAGIEIGVKMIERDPPDVQGATRFATELFLGGIARLSA